MPHYVTAEQLKRARVRLTAKISVVKSADKEIFYDFLIRAYTVVAPHGVITTADEVEATNFYNGGLRRKEVFNG